MSAQPIELPAALSARRRARPGPTLLDADAAPASRLGARRRRLVIGKPLSFGWLLGPVLLVAWWIIGSGVGVIDPRTLPAPWTTVETAAQLIADGRLQANLAVSAGRAAQGLFWGVGVGVVIALISGLSLLGGYLFDGLVQIKRAVPTLALIPLLILWFGIGESMKVITIALGVFVPIYIHTHNALRGIDLKHVELAETLGLERWAFIRHVILPGALPGFMLGLRFGVMGAWLSLVVVEQLNATSGIGYMINLARTYAQSDVILVGLVVYAILGLSSDIAVRALEARALSWRKTFA